MAHPRPRGHTLPELLTVLAILGVLAGFAVPAFTNAMARRQLAATGEGLVASLERARSTAIRRGHPVQVCASADGRACAAGPAWHRGWIARDTGLGTIFDVSEQLSDRIRSLHSAGRTDARFRPDGASPGDNQRITYCLKDTPLTAFTIVISNTGRIRRETSTMSDATACARTAK